MGLLRTVKFKHLGGNRFSKDAETVYMAPAHFMVEGLTIVAIDILDIKSARPNSRIWARIGFDSAEEARAIARDLLAAADVMERIEHKKKPALEKIDVKVRDACGTYVARGGGKTVSCTMDAHHAVKRLAVKLWGEGKHGCACMGHMENGVQRWQIARGA